MGEGNILYQWWNVQNMWGCDIFENLIKLYYHSMQGTKNPEFL